MLLPWLLGLWVRGDGGTRPTYWMGRVPLSPTARPVPGGPLSMSRAVRETLASAVRVRFLTAHFFLQEVNGKDIATLTCCNIFSVSSSSMPFFSRRLRVERVSLFSSGDWQPFFL